MKALVLLFGVAAASLVAATDPFKYEAPEDCRWWLQEQVEEVSLTCSLRTINSDYDTTNFSAIPAEHTVALRIECENERKLKSTIKDMSFSHLVRLRQLVIDNCKLDKWPSKVLHGLHDLHNLTIRTGNSQWTEMSLELAPETFLPVRQLEKLDLSSNNIWSFPENIFCPLTNLMLLNVSENRLQDVSDLGFREKTAQPSVEDSNSPPSPSLTPPCSLDVQILDASHNHFVLLPTNGFSGLRRLDILFIHNNEISMVADKALGGLKHLQIVDMAHNKIVALPPELFRDCMHIIKEIYLQNNSISVLAPGLFNKLSQLLALDLSNNHLTSSWINSDTFTGLIRMVVLNLSHNRLTKLEPKMFRDLYTLQILNLGNNMLETLPADVFAPMNNLHTLVMSYNRVKYLDAYSLNGLYVLSLLSLDYNALANIHPAAFRNCSSLEDINLNDNVLTSVPEALQGMHMLKTADLGENLISSLDQSDFKGLTNLYGLRLIGNQLENLTKNTFTELPSLKILSLARNKLKNIEIGTFDPVPKLQAVRLDSNLLEEIYGLFTHAPSLMWLNISSNLLTHFDYALLSPSVKWLEVNSNKIETLDNSYGPDVELSLQSVDMSFNRLREISSKSVPKNVELLFLNNNMIEFVASHTFMNAKNLTRVDLFANQIPDMELSALTLTPVDPDRALPEFYIGGNPFQCDCTMEWLQRINKLDHLRQHPRVMDLESVYCKILHHREQVYMPLLEAEPSQFLCQYEFHCFTLCHCCDFDACDCEMMCPTNCTCYQDESWRSNIVNCGGAGYVEMPNSIPMDATEVYLDGNNFGELSSHSFIGRKNLKVLYANNSNIAAVYNHTFSGLKRLAVLHLENNYIKELLGFELATLESLKELYLQGNRIHYIDNRTFVELKQLEVLRLDGNRIYGFAVWQFAMNPYLVEIGLGDNPWSCDCTYLRKFREWLHPNTGKVLNYAKTRCVFNNITNALGPPLADFNSTTCSSFLINGASMIESQVIDDYLLLLLITVCAFFVSVGLVCGLFYYRRELRVWIYSRCGLRMCYKTTAFEEEQDKERIFDAYLSYSIKDEAFVSQMLVPGLEDGDPGYRLCLHYRDFNVSAYVADSIIEAVESSKRTIVVLSKNFIHNEWCRFEFKSALHEVLKERRKRLIIILMGELPMRDLDPDLRLYLKTNTCIEWGDRQFWQKLRFSMPDVKKSCHHQRSTVNIYASVNPGQPERSRSPGLPPPPPPGKPPLFLGDSVGSPLASLAPPRDILDQRRMNHQPLWA